MIETNMNEAKRRAADQALIEFDNYDYIGMGTGTTVESLLDILSLNNKYLNLYYTCSSLRTYNYMEKLGFKNLYMPTDGFSIDLYIDGADWIDHQGIAIKGYGAALTQEKLLASIASRRVAIVTKDKVVSAVSGLCSPLPLEVLKIAKSYVAKKLLQDNIQAIFRENVVTDHGNYILDLYGFPWVDHLETENYLKLITGVVESGLFAKYKFDKIYVG